MTPPPLPPEVRVRVVRPHRAGMIVVLGGLGFVFAPCGFVALWLGKRDLRDMAAGNMDRAGEPLTKVGRMLGFVAGIVWAIKWLIASVVGVIVYLNWDRVSRWF
jgi:hypothetical protein